MNMFTEKIKHAAAATLIIAATTNMGCRTGIRRVANAIEGQGATEVKYEKTADSTLFNYLTSENSSFTGSGMKLVLNPETGQYTVDIDDIQMVRTPSDNQQFFAGQLSQGRAADTEAIAGYAAITGAVVGGAVKAAVEAVLPMQINRQDNKTERRQINATRDVNLAAINAEAEATAHAESAE